MAENKKTEYSLQYLANASSDNTVNPPVWRIGLVGKASDGSYYTIPVDPEYGLKVTTDETALNSLIETLQELSQRLAPLAGAISPTAQIRSVVTGAVTATGGGYITSAQAIAALLTQTNTLWINNTTAIQSNINNCVG